ncbi:MAG: hypothetical protein AB8B82_00385 [Roseovarius sp.]
MRLRPGLLLLVGLGLIIFSGVTILQMRMAPVVTPPTTTISQVVKALKAGDTLTKADWAILRQMAADEDPAAQNVLGVALRRNKATRDQARSLFELAAAKGEVGARYNLAVILPDKFRTDPKIIKQRLALLQANVALGDIPSVVELANSLAPINRTAYVPDRETRRRALYAQAAATGDADYLVIYGKALWKDIRGGADPAMIATALSALGQAYEAGDARGAETIGKIFAHGAPDVIDAVPADWTARNPLLWFRRAGDMGLPTARCAFGLELFRTGAWIRTADMSLIERHFRAGPAILSNAPEDLQRALDDLEHCATDPKRLRRANPPFGQDTLYLYKQRGTYTSMSNQPGWANLTLGVIYGYGIGVARDRDRAYGYLDTAVTRDAFDIAAQVKAALPGF